MKTVNLQRQICFISLSFCLLIISAGGEPVVKPKNEKDRLKEMFPALCRADNPKARVSRFCFLPICMNVFENENIINKI